MMSCGGCFYFEINSMQFLICAQGKNATSTCFFWVSLRYYGILVFHEPVRNKVQPKSKYKFQLKNICSMTDFVCIEINEYME